MITINTSPPQVAVYTKCMKVTVDGPREPRSKTRKFIYWSVFGRKITFTSIFWKEYKDDEIFFSLFLNLSISRFKPTSIGLELKLSGIFENSFSEDLIVNYLCAGRYQRCRRLWGIQNNVFHVRKYVGIICNIKHKILPICNA